MLTAIELHAPGAFDPDQFACWSLRRPCGGQGERRRHIGLVPVELSTELRRYSADSNNMPFYLRKPSGVKWHERQNVTQL
jgi:hypothetical protein